MQVITPRLLCSYKSFLRASLYFSTNKNPNKLTVECLNHRGLLRVSGEDVAPFMQGLITNDMKHLTEGAGSMYTMFLNTKGRVLFDAIMYKSPTPDTYLIESDLECLPALQKHLKMYRIRRKIDIDLLDNEYKVWVAFDSTTTDNLVNPLLASTPQGLIVPCNALKDTMTQQNEVMLQGPSGLLMYVDPRLAALGSRFLVAPSTTSEDIARYLGTNITCADTDYKEFRYKLGVGEGVGDLPPGNCFPLEANCDYLHGVSFHKGCYIGQELTARTHHTGVVRKRLMPLLLDQELTVNLEPDTPITTLPETKTPVGKLRGIQGKTALCLLRIAPALVAHKLRIAGPVGVLGTTARPAWWPIEASKEKANIETKN